MTPEAAPSPMSALDAAITPMRDASAISSRRQDASMLPMLRVSIYGKCFAITLTMLAREASEMAQRLDSFETRAPRRRRLSVSYSGMGADGRGKRWSFSDSHDVRIGDCRRGSAGAPSLAIRRIRRYLPIFEISRRSFTRHLIA